MSKLRISTSAKRWTVGAIALTIVSALPIISAAGFAQAGGETQLALSNSAQLRRYVILARTSQLLHKFDKAQSESEAELSFHAYVERLRQQGRVQSGRFNSQGNATIPNLNRTVTYRVYYLCRTGRWEETRFQDVDIADDAVGTVGVAIDANCS